MDILTINDKPGEYPPSYYAATATPPGPYPQATGELSADVCIIGGGFSGLSAALHLARGGMKVIVLEASRVGFGASGRNGGQVGNGQRADQRELEKKHGAETARILWDTGSEAVLLVKSLIEESGADCALTPGIIHPDHKPNYTDDTKAYVEHIRKVYDYQQISFLEREAVGQEIGTNVYHSAYLDMGCAHLHPLRYVFALAELAGAAGAQIFEGSRMIDFTEGKSVTVRTGQATIKADYLLLGLNGYHNNIEKNLSSHVMPINNFIAVTEPLGEDVARSLIKNNYAVADSRFVVNYFRLSQDHRMIFGGGESYGYRFPGDIKAKVRKNMLKIYPQLSDARIDYGWGGTLGITMSRLPFFHRIGGNILTMAGFSGYGVAMGTMSGKIAAETILGQAEKFDIFANLPNASFPGGSALRLPLSAAAMTWYSLRDKL